MKNKAIFFDRDKTLLIPNHDNFIYRVGDFHIPDAFISSLSALNTAEYLLFLVTNQGRVAKGYLSEDDVRGVHKYMEEVLSKKGIGFSEYAYCPHNPVGEVEPYNVVCSCRKPKPGLFKRLIADYKIDVSRSWMVGDTDRDMVAGKSCGLKTILVKTGDYDYADSADYVEDDLTGAVNRILDISL